MTGPRVTAPTKRVTVRPPSTGGAHVTSPGRVVLGRPPAPVVEQDTGRIGVPGPAGPAGAPGPVELLVDDAPPPGPILTPYLRVELDPTGTTAVAVYLGVPDA